MENEEVIIRPLMGADIAAFKEIRMESITNSPTAIWPTAEEEAKQTAEEIRSKIEQTPIQVVFGAFIGDQLVGIAGFRRLPLIQLAHKGSVWGVYVKPEARKGGLARQLFDRIRSHAQEIGVLQIHLSVNVDNHRARNLYTSLGFETFGIEPRGSLVDGQFYDEEHMYLRLDA
jgi:ribosomal protein S18 acetylase RimI-like enzyme